MNDVCWRRVAIASGSGDFLSSLIRISGAMKSFQAARNANSPTVIIPGRTAGRKIRRRAANVPAPSTSADSSSSIGTASNEIRIMNVANGSWNSVSTKREADQRVLQPEELSSTYSGISRDP